MESAVGLLEEDDDLAARVRVEAGAFGAIYRQYFGQIYGYVFYRTQDPQAADDITAQIFEEALKSMRKYRPERAGLATWLFAIARNTTNKHFRSQKIPRWISLEAISPSLAEPGPLVEEIFDQNDRLAGLMRLIVDLDERQRDVLGLKFGAGLSNRRIAELTGLSTSNVGVILYQTIGTLRERLQEVENDEA